MKFARKAPVLPQHFEPIYLIHFIFSALSEREYRPLDTELSNDFCTKILWFSLSASMQRQKSFGPI
jgi:hypothetical protein